MARPSSSPVPRADALGIVLQCTSWLGGSFTARTNTIPFTMALEAIVSPELPLEGLLRLEQTTTYEIGDTRPVGVRVYELSAAGRGRRTATEPPGDALRSADARRAALHAEAATAWPAPWRSKRRRHQGHLRRATRPAR